jgi:signal transduction histidine kinase
MSPRSQNDAKYWVEQAIAFYKACGKRIALAEFNNPNGQFVEDELYVFVLSPKGTMLAHGLNERFVGEEFIDVKDSDGKTHIKEIVDTANAKRSGWVQYKWFHPGLRRVLPKTTYFEMIDDLIICSAVYKVD